ncbi:hypothetical protein U1Q18_015626 [Sarracenia purpurea var. burkii]
MKMMDICESAVSGAEMGVEDKSDSMSEEMETDCDEVESKEEASSEILNVDEMVVNREVMCTDSKPYALVSSSEGFYPVILKLDHVSGLEGKPLCEMGVRHPNAHEVIDERPDPFVSTGSSAHQVLGVMPEHRPVVAAVTNYDLAQSVLDGNKESQAGVAVQSSNAVKLLPLFCISSESRFSDACRVTPVMLHMWPTGQIVVAERTFTELVNRDH